MLQVVRGLSDESESDACGVPVWTAGQAACLVSHVRQLGDSVKPLETKKDGDEALFQKKVLVHVPERDGVGGCQAVQKLGEGGAEQTGVIAEKV